MDIANLDAEPRTTIAAPQDTHEANATEALAAALEEKLGRSSERPLPVMPTSTSADNNPEAEYEVVEVDDAISADDAVAAQKDASDIDPDSAFDGDFKAAIEGPGEFLARRSQLIGWPHHLRGKSRREGLNHHALTISAADPMALRPIEVIVAPDGKFYVKDGRATLEAIDAAHGDDNDLDLRCIMFAGNEADAVQEMCDEALGTLTASALEKARALRSLKAVQRIANTKIAERYPRLTPTKISHMVNAAELEASTPVLFQILEEPDRAPISFGVRIVKAMKTMTPAEITALMDKAQAIFDEGDVLAPTAALRKLGVIDPPKRKRAKVQAIKAVASDPVLCNGVKVGTREVLRDGFTRLRFPARATVEKMADADRADAVRAMQEAVADWFAR